MCPDLLCLPPMVLSEVQSFFSLNTGIAKDTATNKVLVAYSGGMDSGVLLACVAAIKPQMLYAVHVVHNIRPEQELIEECKLIHRVCERFEVPLSIVTIQKGRIATLAKRNNIGTEAAARLFRYKILEKEALRLGARLILTGHHAEDNVETLLGRVLTGSGTEGLKGISPYRKLKSGITIGRPLMKFARQAIEITATGLGLEYSNDSSNRSDTYYRNRIRSSLIPILDQEFKGWKTGITALSVKLSRDAEFIEASVKECMKKVDKENTAEKPLLSIEKKEFLTWHPALQVRVFRNCIVILTGRQRISSRAISQAIMLINEGKNHIKLLGCSVLQNKNMLQISTTLDFQSEGGYFFFAPSEGLYRAGKLELLLSWETPNEDQDINSISAKESSGFIYEGAFTFPLIIRSRKPGDSLQQKNGHLMVDDLFKEWKLDTWNKNRIPVVEDKKGCVALLPGAIVSLRTGKDRFRPYESPLQGRKLYIRLKGA